jgi:hypothetical protein
MPDARTRAARLRTLAAECRRTAVHVQNDRAIAASYEDMARRYDRLAADEEALARALPAPSESEQVLGLEEPENLPTYDNSLDGDTLQKSLSVLKPGGKLISISGPPDPDFARDPGSNWFLRQVMRLLSFGIRRKAIGEKGQSAPDVFHFPIGANGGAAEANAK